MTTTQVLEHEAIKRLSLYLNYLKALPSNGPANITPEKLGEAIGLAPSQVISDVTHIGTENHPRIGYITEYLIADIEHKLGYDNVDRAVLVGVGHLGKAILSYPGFSHYGMEIVAAFDTNPKVIGTEINGITVFDSARMADVCEAFGAHIGILTVPVAVAQSVADEMVECGVRGIWNFAPTYLNVPDSVLVENENIADSLVMLSRRMTDEMVEQEIAAS